MIRMQDARRGRHTVFCAGIAYLCSGVGRPADQVRETEAAQLRVVYLLACTTEATSCGRSKETVHTDWQIAIILNTLSSVRISPPLLRPHEFVNPYMPVDRNCVCILQTKQVFGPTRTISTIWLEMYLQNSVDECLIDVLLYKVNKLYRTYVMYYGYHHA